MDPSPAWIVQHCHSRGAACREGLCQPAGDCTKFSVFQTAIGAMWFHCCFPCLELVVVPTVGIVPACGTREDLLVGDRDNKTLDPWKIRADVPMQPESSLCLLSPELTHPSSPCFILSLLPNPEFLKDFLAGKHCLLRVFSFLPLPAHCLEQQLLTYFCLLIAAAIWILIPESRCIGDAQHMPGPGHLSPRPVFPSPLNPGTP